MLAIIRFTKVPVLNQLEASVGAAMSGLGGEMHVVTYDPSPLPGAFQVHETVDAALDAIKETRQRARAR